MSNYNQVLDTIIPNGARELGDKLIKTVLEIQVEDGSKKSLNRQVKRMEQLYEEARALSKQLLELSASNDTSLNDKNGSHIDITNSILKLAYQIEGNRDKIQNIRKDGNLVALKNELNNTEIKLSSMIEEIKQLLGQITAKLPKATMPSYQGYRALYVPDATVEQIYVPGIDKNLISKLIRLKLSLYNRTITIGNEILTAHNNNENIPEIIGDEQTSKAINVAYFQGLVSVQTIESFFEFPNSGVIEVDAQAVIAAFFEAINQYLTEGQLQEDTWELLATFPKCNSIPEDIKRGMIQFTGTIKSEEIKANENKQTL